MSMGKNKILASTVKNHKENWGGGGGGVTTHFSEIIKLQFGKKIQILLCTLKIFRTIVA